MKVAVCAIVGILLASLVVVLIPCTVYVWGPLQDHMRSSNEQQLEGHTVILAEMDSFFVEEVTVRENVLSRDSSHEIKVYLIKQSCSDIPMHRDVVEYSGHTFLNTSPIIYMITSSTIDVHACVSTEYTIRSQVEFYLMRSVDKSLFNPYEAVSTVIEVGSMGKEKCTNITKYIKDSDYYYVTFLVPSAPLNISYTLRMDIASIDRLALNSSYIGSLRYNDDSLSTRLGGWRETYCLVGSIHSYEAMRPYVNTEVLFSPNYGKTLGISLGLALPLLLLWSICVITTCCYLLYYFTVRV